MPWYFFLPPVFHDKLFYHASNASPSSWSFFFFFFFFFPSALFRRKRFNSRTPSPPPLSFKKISVNTPPPGLFPSGHPFRAAPFPLSDRSDVFDDTRDLVFSLSPVESLVFFVRIRDHRYLFRLQFHCSSGKYCPFAFSAFFSID